MEEKYGMLTVLERAKAPEHLKDKYSAYYLCKCDCGNEKIIRKQSLVYGITKSCGCHRKKVTSERMKENKTHGLSDSRFFKIWSYMKRRCNNPNYSEFHLYGGRGVKLSEEWHTFENFMNDMYDSYIEFEKIHGENTASIDRLDSDGDYCKQNCVWKTQQEQARNRKDNISVVVDNIEYNTIIELAEAYNLDYMLVYSRYKTGKRDVELIAEKKRTHKGINSRGISVEVNGKQYDSLSALQKDYPHISLVSISKRYKKGLRGEELIRSQKTV